MYRERYVFMYEGVRFFISMLFFTRRFMAVYHTVPIFFLLSKLSIIVAIRMDILLPAFSICLLFFSSKYLSSFEVGTLLGCLFSLPRLFTLDRVPSSGGLRGGETRDKRDAKRNKTKRQAHMKARCVFFLHCMALHLWRLAGGLVGWLGWVFYIPSYHMPLEIK